MPLPRPGWRIPHRRTHISRSPLLLREVRRGFSEERQFHFQLAVAALELPHPLVIRHSFRRGCPAHCFRYAFTQKPRVVSFTSSSRATWAIGRELSTTFLAACSL